MKELEENECGYFKQKKSKEEVYLFPTREYSQKIIENRNISSNEAQKILYNYLLNQGYRRSGNILYRNVCPDCKECIPIRINTNKYIFNKKERYILRKNSDITIQICENPNELSTKQKAILYKKYIKRHNPEENNTDEYYNNLINFLNGTKDNLKIYEGTINFDYYLNDQLIASSILDSAFNSMSSNYFYYSIQKDMLKRGLGTFSILNEIKYCQEHNIEYYYLGYYIKNNNKMNYKANFKPHELLINENWIEIKKI